MQSKSKVEAKLSDDDITPTRPVVNVPSVPPYEEILFGLCPRINFSYPVNDRQVQEYWDRIAGLRLG